MKSLQERMNDMKPYFRGIEMYNEAIMVKVVFPNNWSAYPSNDGRVKVTPSDDGTMTYYYADSNEATYEDIFDLIEETIKANQDVLLKLQLLKEKVEELKETFSRLTYEELKTLKFVTESVKKPKGRKKYTKKEKCAQNTQNELTEAIAEQPMEEVEEIKEEMVEKE